MKKEVVEIKNQQEWDYVIEKSTYIDAKSPAHNFRNVKRYFNTNFFGYDSRKKYYTSLGYNIISFEEFKSRYEPQLKIGDTFEYNGFVCRVESEVEEKKWYYNTRTDKYVRTKHYGRHLNEITDKEFIKQLEENAR